MAETHGFIRILPDSTGKRIPQTVMVEVDYNNGTVPIVVGDIIISGTSGIIGTVFESEGTTTSGSLHIRVEEPVSNNLAYIIGENLQINGSTIAKAATVGYPFYYQQLNISGGRNPINSWDILDDGSGLTSFPEGAPSFDAFGKLLIAEQTTIAEYLNKYEVDTDKLQNILVGTASISHIPASSGILFSTGTTSGDKAERISDLYHPYQLGKSRLIEFTCAVGDAGKTNVNRHWGYSDNNDGVLFSLVGTTLNVQLRSSVSGTVVKTYIPRSEWNGDRLDGSGSIFNTSGATLDVSKMNIYWIDLQWLGAGRIRFGVNLNGKRIICHSINNANQNNVPYMRTGSLPIYGEQVNSGIPASSSEFRLWCCVVKQGGRFEPTKINYTVPQFSKTITSTLPVPIATFRSKQTINSLDNRISSFIDSIDAISISSPIQFTIHKNCSLTGSSFEGNSGFAIEYDTSATSMTGGISIESFYIAGGQEKTVDMSNVFDFKKQGIRRKAIISDTPNLYTLSARLLSAGSSAIEVTITLTDIV